MQARELLLQREPLRFEFGKLARDAGLVEALQPRFERLPS
jgi:hypothetical protein